jgi:phosphate acetyltransferase
MGGYIAMGPILQGLNAPINDLSRGCNWKEVYNMAIITANQKELDI